jgi:hypothetical protein
LQEMKAVAVTVLGSHQALSTTGGEGLEQRD